MIKQRCARVAGELNERIRWLLAESQGSGERMGKDFHHLATGLSQLIMSISVVTVCR